MEIKLITKEKDYLEIEVKDANETLLYPLVVQLLLDNNVVEAKYTLDPSGSSIPRVYVRTKEGKPQTALKKAVKTLTSQLEGAQKAFIKSLK